MTQVRSFKEVVQRWGKATVLARELGLPALTVRAWRNRNSIPLAYWDRVAGAAAERGFHDITTDLLFSLAREKAAASETATSPNPIRFEPEPPRKRRAG